MANIRISELTEWTGLTNGLIFVVDNPGQTQTYKVEGNTILRKYVPYILSGETFFTFNKTLTDINMISVDISFATTINLMASPSEGDFFIVKAKNDAETYPITVNGNGNNIDGYSAITINSSGTSYTFVYDGSEYVIV